MTEITVKPFDWNDNFSEEALEDFKGIQRELPYCTCQNIGMALAKLELLEKQGCRIKQWIPVTEKLPKKFSDVNCTCHSLIDDREDWVVETCYIPQPKNSPYSDWGNIPMLNHGECEVIAWMYRDIPEPYKAEKEETRMTYKENITAILECYFAGYKEEIIESACNRILELEPETEQKKGHWIASDVPNEEYVCSECGGACWYYDYQATVKRSEFCPNCGAKMVEPQERSEEE